jgi:hypothetical protein
MIIVWTSMNHYTVKMTIIGTFRRSLLYYVMNALFSQHVRDTI